MEDNIDSNVANNPSSDMEKESKMGGKYADPDLFPADSLIRQMGHNLAESEASFDEKPLRTNKTTELEAKDYEDENDSQSGE